MLRTAIRSTGIAIAVLSAACSPPASPVGVQSSASMTAASSLPQYLQATFRLGTITPDYASATVPVLGDAEAYGFSATDGDLTPLFTATNAVRANVTLPGTANGVLSVSDAASTLGIDVSLTGATSSAAQAVGGYIVYSQGYSGGADVVHRPTRNGAEDFFYFANEPASEHIQYSVMLRDVDGVRFVGETVEFLDASGTPRLHMADPYLIGSDGHQYWAEVRLSGCAADTDPTGPWGRPVTAPGASSAPSTSIGRARECRIRRSWIQHGIRASRSRIRARHIPRHFSRMELFSSREAMAPAIIANCGPRALRIRMLRLAASSRRPILASGTPPHRAARVITS